MGRSQVARNRAARGRGRGRGRGGRGGQGPNNNKQSGTTTIPDQILPRDDRYYSKEAASDQLAEQLLEMRPVYYSGGGGTDDGYYPDDTTSLQGMPDPTAALTNLTKAELFRIPNYLLEPIYGKESSSVSKQTVATSESLVVVHEKKNDPANEAHRGPLESPHNINEEEEEAEELDDWLDSMIS